MAMTENGRMLQVAPWPVALAELVESWRYRPGWTARLVDEYPRDEGTCGLTLVITADTVNSYDHDQPVQINHLFIVPAATYDRRSWRRWLFERCCDVDRHEAAEFFEVDGEKPYAPSHGPGYDPYLVREVGTDLDRRTSFRGEVNP